MALLNHIVITTKVTIPSSSDEVDTNAYKGGSNTPIQRLDTRGVSQEGQIPVPAIVKQYGYEPDDRAVRKGIFGPHQLLQVLSDMERVRGVLAEAGINTPSLLGWALIPEELSYSDGLSWYLNNHGFSTEIKFFPDASNNYRLLIIETDEGRPISKVIAEGKNGKSIEPILQKLILMILRMPTSIPIDTNIDNFTLNESGKICFIDFAPPRIRGYEHQLLKTLFPNAFCGNSSLRKAARNFLYYNPFGRLLKFEYHLMKSSLPKSIKSQIKDLIGSRFVTE